MSHKLKPVRQQNTQNHVNAINGLAAVRNTDFCASAPTSSSSRPSPFSIVPVPHSGRVYSSLPPSWSLRPVCRQPHHGMPDRTRLPVARPRDGRSNSSSWSGGCLWLAVVSSWSLHYLRLVESAITSLCDVIYFVALCWLVAPRCAKRYSSQTLGTATTRPGVQSPDSSGHRAHCWRYPWPTLRS
jgi:hypothetical protein